jgi:hypothetical protein
MFVVVVVVVVGLMMTTTPRAIAVGFIVIVVAVLRLLKTHFCLIIEHNVVAVIEYIIVQDEKASKGHQHRAKE